MAPVGSSLVGGASTYSARSLSTSSSKGKSSDGVTKSSSSGYGYAPGGAKNSSIVAPTRV